MPLLARFQSPRVSDVEVLEMTRQFTILLKAHYPLTDILDWLARETKDKKLKRLIVTIRKKVTDGQALSQAFRSFRQVFGDIYIHLLEVGEKAGQLSHIMGLLTSQLEQKIKYKHQIRSALVYPSLVILVAVGVIVFMLKSLVPNFQQMMIGYDLEMPASTVFLMKLSANLEENYLVILLMVVIVAYGFKWLIQNTSHARALWRKIPLLGKILILNRDLLLLSNLHILLGSGLPLLQSITLCKKISPDIDMRKNLGRVERRLKKGEDFGSALTHVGVFNPQTDSLLSFGSDGGRISEVIGVLIDEHQEKLSREIKTMLSLIEPALIIVLGGIIGMILISLYSPLFQLMEMVG